ncbi:MAG: hypothetical protein RL341_1690, partial [Pseudomonadota bacterium]
MWTFSSSDLSRIVRDLVFGELYALPGLRHALPARLNCGDLNLRSDALNLDSLQRVQVATAAATWFNVFDAGYEDLFLARAQTADWPDVVIRARENGARDFTFSTSGSTGERKHIRHAEQSLISEATAWSKTFSGTRRVVVMCPVHHIYGFIFGVLLPSQLNVPVVECSHEQLTELRAGDLLIGVPAQWDWLSQRKKPFAQGVRGVSSTAPLPAQVNLSLRALGLDSIHEIYGSTETAGLGFRTAPDAPYTLLDGRIALPDGQIGTPMESGELGLLAVQDELVWHDPQHFSVGKRADGMVQVGGHNVSPQWVAEQLKQSPLVVDAAVRLDSTAATARLKAFAVLSSDASAPAF